MPDDARHEAPKKTTRLPVLGPRLLPRGERPVLEGTFDVKTREHVPVSEGVVKGARVVAEAMFATERGAPPAERLDWLEKELGSFLGHAGADARLIFSASLFVVTVIGPLVWFRPGFSGRSLEERRELLERAEHGLFSTPLLGVKAILCILYFEHPDAAREIGADGGCLLEGAK
jgi:hypothetical protein